MNVYSLLEATKPQTAVSPEYAAKMLHDVPDAPVVRRYEYLLQKAAGKSILDIGCTGPFSPELAKVAREYHGIDREPVDLPGTQILDVETASALPHLPDVELVIASEILEHLANAGRFLELLRRYHCPIILTVPNAFSRASHSYMKRGVECVNKEHVAWYSWHTMMMLLERLGYDVLDWRWYNGVPLTAEGLIFEVQHGQT